MPASAFSWNSVGHQLVAQIALDQLTPAQQKYWKNRIQKLNVAYPNETFIRASTLPDELRQHDINVYNTWHFINLPIFQNNQHNTRYHPVIFYENLVWALNQSLKIEKSRHANVFEKAFFGSFLIHLVGDAHQPLHCASLYNDHFPRGDRGGNLYKIKHYRWHNLHSYWDNGGGFLSKHLNTKTTAKRLEEKYPPIYFKKQLQEKSFQAWTKESNIIAQKYAYSLPEYSQPSKAYQQKVQQITQEQIVLAGYRLAWILSISE